MALGKAMELSGVGGTQGSFAHAIQKMVGCQMINRYGNNRRANFTINYMHRDVPGYVLEKMPEEARRARANLEYELSKTKDQHLDDVGCVVTKPEKCVEQEPEEPEAKLVESPYDEMREYAATAERVEEPVVPTQMSVSKENGEVKISLTLNINLNI